ncbi:uncharacterized protein A1O9_00629 [Exophiala aquamarina CBS 119918]|uniref:Uncharacterized protein n=1 Tax=Exophiala aquamarina CBS 119918 TaxID=1182545 RepID=A0A072PS08_9EURO|nr:uncharacterized protein A1O9_00629 [Exophiala aquamarina CBS 119918]KEF62656.1 hypothetical protein A1O9_00629 [Exophiala aquamarina CBS 119918]
MAETNGISSNHDGDTIAIASSHLGKRKRTLSPEPTTPAEKLQDPSLHHTLQNVLCLFRKHDTRPSLLKCHLPSSSSESPSAKKARLADVDKTNDTIEHRILTDSYTSLESLMEDVNTARSALLDGFSHSNLNGQTPTVTSSEVDLKAQLTHLVSLVGGYLKEPTKLPNGHTPSNAVEEVNDPIQSNARTGHVLSLRTQTNGQMQHLFSGLQERRTTGENEGGAGGDIDGLALPNGFELTAFAALNGGTKSRKLGPRSFGEVFGLPTAARARLLEEPRPSRTSTTSNQLKFIPHSDIFDRSLNIKGDYRNARLPAGSWVSYGGNNFQTSSQSAGNDFNSGLLANELLQPGLTDDDALFRSVYSSFAPTSDNSAALISSEDISERWWRKSGSRKISALFTATDGQELDDDYDTTQGLEEFDNILKNWVPDEHEAFPDGPSEENKDTDELLQEVSDLIQTLSSYQENRSLDPPGRAPKPSGQEFDTFEMLRTQIRLLVDGLPPFAVAKLNGGQLEKLNISTNLLTKAPEYAGTGQLEEYAANGQRTSVTATSAANRPGGTVQVRPSYTQPQTTTPAFNVQARTFNSSVPATAPYGVRTAPNYQTPTVARPPYSQTPYQPQNTPYSSTRATIQQYQRSLQNGLGNYTNSQVQAQTPGLGQRPTQPGYQQRAQDSPMTALARSGSPQKPMVMYTPRGLTQNPYPYQRPNPGTPPTPSYAQIAGSVTGRYDGIADPPKSEFVGAGEGQGPTKSQSPAIAAAAMSQSQTVEVSR